MFTSSFIASARRRLLFLAGIVSTTQRYALGETAAWDQLIRIARFNDSVRR